MLALVYTSSAFVVAGETMVRAQEDAPVITPASRGHEYAEAKATAETLVLASNQPIPGMPAPTVADNTFPGCLRTIALRPTAMYCTANVIQSSLTGF